jgi:hypothetical protein
MQQYSGTQGVRHVTNPTPWCGIPSCSPRQSDVHIREVDYFVLPHLGVSTRYFV